jgi:AMP-activated protein kinase-like protein
MNPVTIFRRIAKPQYAAVRRPFAFFDDRLLARYWNQDAILRSGFGRLLAAMDRFAGWLLADDTISQRGRDLLGRTGPTSDAREQAAQEQAAAPPEEDSQHVPGAADAPAETGQPVAAEPARHGLAAREPAAQPGTSAEPAAARTVDVTFTLPGEVGAGNVLLCGDFNDWSAGNIALHRGSDGAWQVTLPLEPGRSYRYRYLLDGERWENAWHADWYEPNAFGSTNSVVIVDFPEHTLELAA